MSFLGRELRRLRRRVRHARRPPALILLYHRVAALPGDPQALAVTPARFAEQLDALRAHRRPIPLADLRRGLADGELPRGAVAITFDDGYADNLHAARPLLARAGVPATVYVTTGKLGTARELWWDELERLLLATPGLPARLDLAVGGARRSWDLGEGGAAPAGWSVLDGTLPSGRHRAYVELAGLLNPLPAPEREAVLAALRALAGAGEGGRESHRALTEAEVAALAEGGLVDVGAHTVTHSRLSALPLDAQRREIREGRTRLEGILGRRVTTFSYPYGTRESYGPETVTLVREEGFESACSNFPGLVERGTDPFQLPRFLVRDWSGDALLARLRAWEAEE